LRQSGRKRLGDFGSPTAPRMIPRRTKRGNVVPYFIGVFDTVAALGASGIKKWSILSISALIGLGLPTWLTFGVVAAVVGLLVAAYLYNVRVKVIHDFPTPGKSRRHWSSWRFKHYDQFLGKRVRYARHAQAIDENRADFARVGWGRRTDMADAPKDWLVQIWFAGNHSDIGGSYPETESRLSDIALKWMVDEATNIPHPIIVDFSKLHMFPAADGMQHDEVASVLDGYPGWFPRRWRMSWKPAIRDKVSAAGMPSERPGALQASIYPVPRSFSAVSP
jgi:hypothetical protein